MLKIGENERLFLKKRVGRAGTCKEKRNKVMAEFNCRHSLELKLVMYMDLES